MSKVLLGVNIDHVATLRQARGTRYPEPVQAALVAEQAGADGITVHLREDRRHIQERDVRLLQQMTQTRVNLELAVQDQVLGFALELQPQHCCLVPERREELTTEGGLDVKGQFKRIKGAVTDLVQADIEVSLFIDPEADQVKAAADTGAQAIELHTGAYADGGPAEQKAELQRLQHCAQLASELGLVVNAGHGLHYHNIEPIAAIAPLNELNIGHSIISRSFFVGLKVAVQEMKHLMNAARVAP